MYTSQVATPLNQDRYLVASIIPQSVSDEVAFRDLKELKELVDTYGGKVIEFVIQHREIHDKGQYLGRGKIDEISQCVKKNDIDIVVLNATVKPTHIYDMKSFLEKQNPKVQVWDRIDLILEIFSKHASTTEAKLQIKLAAMRHMGPRIYGLGHVLSRQGGSIGTRGIGETNTELMKRHWRAQIRKTQERLEKHEKDRERQLERRRKLGLRTISIVGYTNAGKTSLYNYLTKKHNLVQNALFATLDASVGKMTLPKSDETVLISDTIGFVRNLPPSLISAFTSTLMESVQSDLLLHVIDCSDPDRYRKMKAVEAILSDLHLSHKKTLYVFNKADLLPSKQKQLLTKLYAAYAPLFISVNKKTGLDKLCLTIDQSLLT